MHATALVFDGTGATQADLATARGAIGRARLVWIDVDGRSPEVEHLLPELQLHPLTIEDIFETGTIPKVEDFGRYLYVRAHGIAVPPQRPQDLRKEELDIVIGDRWLLTHHSPQLQACGGVREQALRTGQALDATRLAHLLLDRLVDDSLPAMDAIDEAVEALEKASVARVPRRNLVAQVMALRGALHRFRRTAVHQREILLRLARGEFSTIPAEQLPFFRDVYDHASRLADLADDARDMLAAVLEAHLSMVSNRLNEVTKVLTMTATVFLPLTFIAGVYGMNFEFMPELHWRWGYPVVLATMALTALGLVWWFRRRGWMD
jgi:magnesium transporter